MPLVQRDLYLRLALVDLWHKPSVRLVGPLRQLSGGAVACVTALAEPVAPPGTQAWMELAE